MIGAVGLALILAALIWYSIANVWKVWHWGLLAIGALGLAYFLYVYFTKRDKALSARSIKYGSNILVQVVIMLVIVGLLAFVTTRRNFRTDWTKNSLYSLSDQTGKLLGGLSKDVEIKAFYKLSEQSGARDLLDEFTYRSGRLNYELVDPDEKPQIAKQYGIGRYNMISVECGVKRELVEEMSESNLTNAILKVTRDQEKVIYFLSGHGERSINDADVEGYQKAAEAIRKENYLTRDLNLVRRRSVPDSCTALAIIGPKSNFFPGELDSIKNYVDNGGKLLVMLDPECPQDIAVFMKNFRIDVGNNMVIDVSGMGQLFGGGPGIPIAGTYDKTHPITKDFSIMTFYPYACSITPQTDKGSFDITELCKTSEESWADADYASGKVAYEEDRDIRGPITLAAAVRKEDGGKKSTVVIFGDSDFAKNGYFNNQGNVNLFLNTVNFLAEEEDMISIRPKEVDDRRLTMTQADVSSLFYLVVIAVPVLVVILGIVVYLRRNR
jgi:ABC-type uncharacterized transport system involved in gliding motility auxiliary subunit